MTGLPLTNEYTESGKDWRKKSSEFSLLKPDVDSPNTDDKVMQRKTAIIISIVFIERMVKVMDLEPESYPFHDLYQCL